MKPDQIALLLSCLSLVVAAIALGWNIYRDVVLKPRLKVSVDKGFIVSEIQKSENKLMISAVNHGPGKIRLNIVKFKSTSFLKRLRGKSKFGVVIHDYRNAQSGQLPTTLDVGEKLDLIFPWNSENVFSLAPSHIGITDSFGRTHWAKSKEIKKASAQWQANFAGTSITEPSPRA